MERSLHFQSRMTTDERDPATPNRAMSALREAIRAFNVATKQLERRFGLSGSQLEALEILEQNPGLSPSDLACRSSTDQSTASVVVKRLAESGLVERRKADGDRRRTIITLTDAGREILAKAPPSMPAQLRAAFMRLTQSDRITLTQLLERWLSLAGLKRAA
jgi:DNA-binding MarR family transcriptional regulator